MITIKQIINIHFSKMKYAALETGEDRLKRHIIEYAKQKCKEQREICSQVDEISCMVETLEDVEEHRNAVKNAKEPIFN